MTEEKNVKQELEAILAEIRWEELRNELLRDVIILVNSSLVLLDVAVACAEDNKELFQSYLDKGLISKPDEATIAKWEKENPFLSSVIVKPFVFVQEIERH